MPTSLSLLATWIPGNGDKRPPAVRSSLIFHAQPCGAPHYSWSCVMHHGAHVHWDVQLACCLLLHLTWTFQA